MKKLIIPFLLVMALVFQSCEETQSPIYDGNQTLAYFPGTSAILEVELGSSAEINVDLNVSTLSASDRTVDISVNAGGTTATPGMYSFNSTVTIPANTYFSSFTIMGMDDGLTTAGATLSVQIDGVSDGGVGSPITYDLTLVEICPLDPTFGTGNYLMEQIAPSTGGAFGVPVFNTQVVAITSSGATTRSFEAEYLEAFNINGNGPLPVPFTFLCGEVVPVSATPTSLLCVQGEPTINLGPSDVFGTFDPTDDTTFTMIIVEGFSETGGCAGLANGPVESTFRFTKQ